MYIKTMILASGSPRRQEIMRIAGYDFQIVIPDIDEVYPENLTIYEVPLYLAEQKALSVRDRFTEETIITADTIVVLDGKIIGKPATLDDAREMLAMLSGKTHQVITGVCVMKDGNKNSFTDESKVRFAKLTQEEIDFYVTYHQPLDKAGAYGVQDWIGMIAIERIEGSFYNVMGLPIHKLYQALK